MDEEFFSIHEAAAMLKVADSTIRKNLSNGKLKGMKIGRIWRISKSDIDLFVRRAYGTAAERVKDDGGGKKEGELDAGD